MGLLPWLLKMLESSPHTQLRQKFENIFVFLACVVQDTQGYVRWFLPRTGAMTLGRDPVYANTLSIPVLRVSAENVLFSAVYASMQVARVLYLYSFDLPWRFVFLP